MSIKSVEQNFWDVETSSRGSSQCSDENAIVMDDEKDRTSVSDTIKISSAKNAELEILHEGLLRLPVSNIHSFFSAFRKLRDQLNAKYNDCEDEVTFMREDIPSKVSDLKQCRLELSALRSALVEACEEYTSKHGTFMRSFQKTLLKQSPTKYERLMASIESVAFLEKRLKPLKAIRSWFLLADQLEDAVRSKNCSEICSSIHQIGSISCEGFDAEVEEKLLERREELWREANDSVGRLLADLLSEIGYPFEDSIDLQSVKGKLDDLIAILDSISALNATTTHNATRNELIDVLFEPFAKRFSFHFYGDVRTNVPSKPEWMFTQIINWLTVNCELLETIFSRIFTNNNEAIRHQRLLESRLVDKAVEKTRSLAQKLLGDTKLFSHLIDEAVVFENELKDLGYQSLMGRVLGVFCEEPFSKVWLDLERKSCTSGVEHILMSDSRWKSRYSEVSDLDMHRVPECTDQFIVLIESITERYRWLPDVDMQARFLELQVLMLDEFRLRLVQISQQLRSPWDEPFIQLLNSFWYIGCVLEEWNDIDVFIRVQSKGTNLRLRGMFDDMSDMYRHIWKQRAADMGAAFRQFIRSQLDNYWRLNWFSMQTSKPLDLTPTFCPFLLELRLLLGRITSDVSPDSALTLYRSLNRKIGEVLLELINNTAFNYQGATQMLFDITSSLIPLLNSLYSRTTMVTYEALDDEKFEEAISALKLLAIPTASALLLKSEIKKSPEEMLSKILAPYDVSLIGRNNALALLEQRCDLQLDDADVGLRIQSPF